MTRELFWLTLTVILTGLMCVPWLQAMPDDHSTIAGAQRGTELARKIDATHNFAEQVVEPCADI